jgi:hypothetical protein
MKAAAGTTGADPAGQYWLPPVEPELPLDEWLPPEPDDCPLVPEAEELPELGELVPEWDELPGDPPPELVAD